MRWLSILAIAIAAPAGASLGARQLIDNVANAVAIPEAGNFALFLLGVAGLVIGRRASKVRARPPESDLDG
jgi:hypothetical protein